MALSFIGDSHLARLWSSGTRFPVNARLDFHCERGGGLGYLQSTIEEFEWETAELPDVAVIFLGGNDVDSWDCSPVELAGVYAVYLNRLADMGTRVMFMAQWPRPGARIGGVNFMTNVGLFEEALRCRVAQGVWLWQWDRGMRFSDSFFGRDGVHCSAFKYRKVARYLAAAGIAGFRNLHWWKFH
jgi:hypothetical protein